VDFSLLNRQRTIRIGETKITCPGDCAEAPPEPIVAVCGDGIVEDTETWQTCCLDTGCPQNYICITASTGDEMCVPVEVTECITDADCLDQEFCNTGKVCVLVDCPCGELLPHGCYAYECCNNAMCTGAENYCIDEGTPQSHCEILSTPPEGSK